MGRLIISKESYSLKHITQVIQTPTIDYLRYLLDQSPNQRLLLFWDGASYHRSRVVQGFLGEVNEGLPPEQWKIHARPLRSQLSVTKSALRIFGCRLKHGFDVFVL
jgi:hypothetical protein